MKSILVVDDNTTNLKFVESVLRDKYKLSCVKSGEQALKFLSRNTADLVLLDLMMPQMDGFETYDRIRELDNNSNIPIIFLTADSDVESEIKCLKMGAKDFIKKPFVPEVMINRIERILELEELNRNLEQKVEEKTNQIEQLSFEIIATIASMIEAKDSYTKGHSVRVAEYSSMIARELGWSDEDVQNLRYIALLHDIGKIGVPDTVLNKPGKLTEIEFNIIKSHTTVGGEILKDIETIDGVDKGARYHHERYDGKGYPCQLSGEDIPVVARIICIADAYDAMNSRRIYRDKLPQDKIRQELEKGSGAQFDPVFLKAFLKLFDEGKLNADKIVMEAERGLSSESTQLFNQVMSSIEAENQKNESYDFLTGLLNRQKGESKIAEAMENECGYLAFVDLDNLKQTNDTMGHLAGDYALKTVGEVLSEYGQNAIVVRIGGDEFLYYMIGAGRDTAEAKIQQIISSFDDRKAQNAYLSASSLSIGLCVSTPADSYGDVLKKADKALYHIKQSGKRGYYFYTNSLNDAHQKNSVDLKRLVNNLKDNNAYNGSFNVQYREFVRIYDFIRNLAERYNHNMQLIIVTLESDSMVDFAIDEKEHAMSCMERAIKDSLRKVDVCTRFSGEQYLIVLINAEQDDIAIISNRIFENFYKMYQGKKVNLSYDIEEVVNEK